eukprot:1161075-Pelagomonas_calceolata.AAC.20
MHLATTRLNEASTPRNTQHPCHILAHVRRLRRQAHHATCSNHTNMHAYVRRLKEASQPEPERSCQSDSSPVSCVLMYAGHSFFSRVRRLKEASQPEPEWSCQSDSSPVSFVLMYAGHSFFPCVRRLKEASLPEPERSCQSDSSPWLQRSFKDTYCASQGLSHVPHLPEIHKSHSSEHVCRLDDTGFEHSSGDVQARASKPGPAGRSSALQHYHQHYYNRRERVPLAARARGEVFYPGKKLLYHEHQQCYLSFCAGQLKALRHGSILATVCNVEGGWSALSFRWGSCTFFWPPIQYYAALHANHSRYE